MDERGQQLISKGIALTLALLYVALFVSAVWKYVSTKDITNSTLEIILIVMIPASIAWFARKDESLTIPRMMSGETVPTGTDIPSKKMRKRHYLTLGQGDRYIVPGLQYTCLSSPISFLFCFLDVFCYFLYS